MLQLRTCFVVSRCHRMPSLQFNRRIRQRRRHPRRHRRLRHVARHRVHQTDQRSRSDRPLRRSSKSSPPSPAAAPTPRKHGSRDGYVKQLRETGRQDRRLARRARRSDATSSCSKASTAAPTWNNSAPSPKASQSSSISRPPARSPTAHDLPHRRRNAHARVTRPRRSASAKKSKPPPTDKAIGDMLGCETLEPDVDRKAPPRSVLVRHPRRRAAVHDHGHRLRDASAAPIRRSRPSSSANGKTAASAPTAA